MNNANRYFTPVTILIVSAALTALPAVASAQDSCAESPELSSCSSTPVGVCDAAAAAGYVIHEGDNNWLVRPMEDDGTYPGQCSFDNGVDVMNPRTITSKDDTNNLQCALDFAAAGRTSADESSTIRLEQGRYCVRSTLVGLDFSGAIRGAGKNRTTIDFDNPALVNDQGHLTGEGGFRQLFIIEKSVVNAEGVPIDLLDRVEQEGDTPSTTTVARYLESNTGGLVFANNRFNARRLLVKDLHLSVSKGTRAFAQTIHGFANVSERPGSIGSIFTDTTVLGGDSVSLGGRSNEFYRNCLFRAEETLNYNGQAHYLADTGVDLSAVDPQLCIVPINDPASIESPILPRNCSLDSCLPYAYDMDNLPALDTRFVSIKATAYGNTNNGLYYLNAERNLSVDIPVSGEEPIRNLTQPVQLNLVLKDAILRGLSSPLVGTLMDFGGTPIVDGRVVIKDNYMGVMKAGEAYGCGRIWERLELSGTPFIMQDNKIIGCQGTIIRHAVDQFSRGRAIDAGYISAGNSAKPVPDVSVMTVRRNVYKQGAVVRGFEDLVPSFLLAVDYLNSQATEDVAGVPFSTLKIRLLDNTIRTANYQGEAIDPYGDVPVSLFGLSNAIIRGNTFRGKSAAAIAIGQPLGFGSLDRNSRIVDNDLTAFSVISCDTSPDLTVCSGNTAAEQEATTKKIWLGPLTSEVTVISSDPGSDSVGDLGQGNTVLP